MNLCKKSASEVGAAVITQKRPTVVDVKHTMTTQCWTTIYSVGVLQFLWGKGRFHQLGTHFLE